MPPQDWGVTTQRGDRIFVHLLDPQAPAELTLPGTGHLRPLEAGLLEAGAPVPVAGDGDIRLTVDPALRDPVDTVVEVLVEPR